MGLEEFKTEPTRISEKKKHQKESLCPECGDEGDHIRDNEWRCVTDEGECRVLTWRHTDFKLNNATLHEL